MSTTREMLPQTTRLMYQLAATAREARDAQDRVRRLAVSLVTLGIDAGVVAQAADTTEATVAKWCDEPADEPADEQTVRTDWRTAWLTTWLAVRDGRS